MIGTYKLKLVLISFCFFLNLAYAEKTQEEKELDSVNFNNIKSVLQKDGLSKEVTTKKSKVRSIKKAKQKIEKDRFYYPTESEFWGLASEFWLVKNAQIMGWDFEKPDYGLETSFKNILEKLGFIQRKFKILILNTPSLVRASVPGFDGEMIFLISLPFIRNLDLSKMEISVLLLEDFFRLQQNYLKKSFDDSRLKKIASTNFKGRSPETQILDLQVNHINNFFLNKGFSFQQQFEITKKMDSYLKSMPDLWGIYYRLNIKLDKFLKTNIQYKNYLKLYPSPEMQTKWLSPEEKVF